MTIQKYTTKIHNANKNSSTLRSVIPSDIVTHLQLSSDDTLKWIILDDGTVQLEKLEL